MPELPEVETTRRGIEPWLAGSRVQGVRVRQRRLRWPVPRRLDRELPGRRIAGLDRRAKYILMKAGSGTVIMHLGMSGSLRIMADGQPAGAHDHVDFTFDSGRVLRFTDPRRFGSILWTTRSPATHPLLKHLGPEPLDIAFSGEYLYQRSRDRRLAVKNFIMDSRIVVGVGNIYASESLFRAGIHPSRAAGRISLARYEQLVAAIQEVLAAAIRAGGTTLRDFTGGDGKPGYFVHELAVYDRADKPCLACASPLRRKVIGQRSTYYCQHCQR